MTRDKVRVVCGELGGQNGRWRGRESRPTLSRHLSASAHASFHLSNIAPALRMSLLKRPFRDASAPRGSHELINDEYYLSNRSLLLFDKCDELCRSGDEVSVPGVLPANDEPRVVRPHRHEHACKASTGERESSRHLHRINMHNRTLRTVSRIVGGRIGCMGNQSARTVRARRRQASSSRRIRQRRSPFFIGRSLRPSPTEGLVGRRSEPMRDRS